MSAFGYNNFLYHERPSQGGGGGKKKHLIHLKRVISPKNNYCRRSPSYIMKQSKIKLIFLHCAMWLLTYRDFSPKTLLFKRFCYLHEMFTFFYINEV